MAKLWQLDYGYKVKPLEGKNKNQEGYVTGVSEDGKIKINLDERPYSGEHHIIEAVSNLKVLVIGNPHDIWDVEIVRDKKGGGHELTDKVNEQTEFTIAKLDLLATNPQKILDNKEYFTVLPNDDWIESAEKQLEKSIYGKGKKIKKYYNKIKTEIIYIFDILLNRPGKKEVSNYLQSINKRLDKEGKKP